MDIPNQIKLFPIRVESAMLKRWYFWILLPFFLLLFLSLIWGTSLYKYQSGRDHFGAGDFLDAPALSEKILRATNGVSLLVQKRLSPTTLISLTNLRPWSSNHSETYRMLAGDMERIAHTNHTLFDSSRIKTSQLFTNISLRRETKRMLYSNLGSNELVKLNRMLLEDAYPDEIIPKMTLGKNLLYSAKLSFKWVWGVYVGGAALMLAAFFFVRIQKGIGATLKTLVQSGTLQPLDPTQSISEQVTSYLNDFQAALKSWKRWLVITAILAVGISYALQTQPLSEIWFVFGPKAGLVDFRWAEAAMNFTVVWVMTLLYGYGVAAGVWATYVTMRYVWCLAERFKIVVNPAHPDGCGGLVPIGSFSLLLATPVLVGIALIAFYGVKSICRDADSQIGMTFLIYNVIIMLGVLIPLASGIFFCTVWRFHLILSDQQRINDNSYAKLEATCRAHLDAAVAAGNAEDIRKDAEALKALQELGSRWSGFSSWPFNRIILAKFLSPQIASIGSFLFPVVKKLTEH